MQLLSLPMQKLAPGEHLHTVVMPPGMVRAEIALRGVPPGEPNVFGEVAVLFNGEKLLGSSNLHRGGLRGNYTGFTIEMADQLPNGELRPRKLYEGEYLIVLDIADEVEAAVEFLVS